MGRTKTTPWVWALAMGAAAPGAWGQPIPQCIDAAERGQELRDEGQLIDARAAFQSCTAAECPTPLRKDCARWFRDVDDAVPSIVPRAVDEDGADLPHATLEIDGIAVAVDGRPIELDPGRHVLRWSDDGELTIQTIIARAGEQNRLVDAVLGPSPVPRPEPEPAPPPVSEPRAAPTPDAGSFVFPVPAAIAAGAGAAGLVVFAVFATRAEDRFDSLVDSGCPSTPTGCASADIDRIETDLLVANITLGVGATAFATAAVLLIVANVMDDDPGEAAVTVSPVGDLGAGLRLRF